MIDCLALLGGSAAAQNLIIVNDGGDVVFGHSATFGTVAMISK